MKLKICMMYKVNKMKIGLIKGEIQRLYEECGKRRFDHFELEVIDNV